MSKPAFVVSVADLERGPHSVTWVIPEPWLRTVLADSGATPRADGSLEVELSKNGREVLVRGRAQVSVSMPCVVTMDPLPLELEPEILLLLAPAAPKQPTGRSSRDHGRAGAHRGANQPAKGRSNEGGWPEDPELNPLDAAKDTYDGERVVLDEFLREFILLELPMYPRRSDLPSVETPAIAPPSPAEPPQVIDPRLLPLAAIASRLRDQKKE